MRELGYDQGDFSTDPGTAAGIGNLAAEAVLAFRHYDGSNQLGDLAPGRYLDYTGYEPVNEPTRIVDPNRWQPLIIPDQQGGVTTQRFLAPHWGLVTPFAMTSGAQFRPASVPNLYPSPGYTQQVDEILAISAELTDRDKAAAEYWSDGPLSELPPGHWILFAQFVSRRDEHSLDDDVKLMFAMSNAMLDASIAVWDCKRAFDYVRPVTAVRFLMAGREIRAWGGPNKGTLTIRGEDWRPYQTVNVPTPPFPEFSSGHSAFSTAAAEVLKSFTGSDAFGGSAVVKAGSSRIEPGAVPSSDVLLSWPTFTAAADEAGFSRRLGGIHFEEGDLQSRAMGRNVGSQAWAKAAAYFNGGAQ
ncbi:MAG: vanadium-dependent haloperoxidase [Chloroflexota bacterium]|nr:vanadium-dependent haloperoxidase [Chloroflexota bacterium]